MTDNVWSAVPDGTELAEGETFDLGRWDVPPDTTRSAHERAIEDAREQARGYFVDRTFAGSWAPRPDIAHWPKVYRKAFDDELARLERERQEQADDAVRATAARASGGPAGPR